MKQRFQLQIIEPNLRFLKKKLLILTYFRKIQFNDLVQ